MKKLKLRILEKKKNGKWIRCQMKELRKGDLFRMFEPDDLERVRSGRRSVFKCLKDPKKIVGGIWSIETDG